MIKRKLLYLTILLMTLSGCITPSQPLTPRQELRLTQKTFEEVIDTLIILKDEFNEDEWQDIEKLADSGGEFLAQWTLAVLKEESPTMIDKFRAVLQQLIEYRKRGN